MSAFAGPDAADNGLIYYMDAANNKSYSGSGTSVNDLSGNNYTGTLVNGVTYSSTNQGIFTFDGTNDYMTLPSSSNLLTFGTNDFSVTFWINLVSSSNNQTIFTNYNSYNTNYVSYFAIMYYQPSLGLGIFDSSGNIVSGSAITASSWTQYCFTKSGTTFSTYKNGVLAHSATSAANNFSGSGRTILVGGGLGDYPYMNGSIGNIQVNNRSLSASEILLNFNATKGRYKPQLPTGGTITQVGSYRIHTFTASSSFITNDFGGSVDSLVVAGGGGGGGYTGGGGGAGGYIFVANSVLTQNTTYTVTVGGGGAGGAGFAGGTAGNNSVFNSQTAIGGGAGGTNNCTGGSSGGSGGGTGAACSNPGSAGTTGQGFAGGAGAGAPNFGAGGGGGAGGAGVDGTTTVGGNGGPGVPNAISGTTTYYAGGGGGGTYLGGTLGTGGIGGGGSAAWGNGTANTGGGGGGSKDNSGTTAGTGGSGVVIVRYKFPF